MKSLDRHISKHTAVFAVAFVGFCSAVVFFLVRVISTSIEAITSHRMVSFLELCGCALTAAWTNHPTLTVILGVLSIIVLAFVIRIAVAVSASVWRTQRLLRRLRTSALTIPSELVGRRLPNRFLLVPDAPEGLMTIGFLRPWVVLSESFRRRLTPNELAAALAHEAAHVRRRDPLRQLLLIGIRAGFGFVPAVRRAVRALETEIELSADAAASDGYRVTEPLSRAFVKAISVSGRRSPAYVATPFSVVNDRLEQLLEPMRPLPRQIPSGYFLLAVAVVSAALFLAAGRGIAQAFDAPPASAIGEQCQPSPRCERSHMTPAENASTEWGMCTGECAMAH